ncbi:streptophobe family protein [Streptomyces humi]|uniref:streptophobe family protein n=1 Tax=Streptomyces humi TaxID=1428620 RepID=UPI000628913A|nr:streptophobe family protein [Streptomyces humi]
MGSGTSGTGVESARGGARLPWVDILLSAIAAVSWALIGMAGTAALGLHLLRADAAGSLGPMTAAVVALGAGGSVTPNGDLSAFGLKGAQATTAIEITPLGVSLVGALLLSWFFLRSLRTAGVVVAPAELLARAGSVVVLFVATLGGLAWAGHSVVTIDGGALGLDGLTGAAGGGGGGGLNIPGIGDVGGLLPDRLGDLVKADAAVGFRVDTAATLTGGLAWCAGILLIALLASRRTPLPRGWEAVHRVVRPAASALVTVLLVAVAAGWAAAAYAAVGDPHPARVAGAALLGAPNGVWLGVPIGLLVPFDGRATGVLTAFLPHPLDDFLTSGSGRSVTLGHLAELDGRVWLLGVAAALLMLLTGVFTAVRTPVGRTRLGRDSVGRGVVEVVEQGAAAGWEGGAGRGALGFAGRCAVRLGIATALTLPLLAWLTGVSVDASLSVLGFDAFGAGIELHGQLGTALLLGAAWGAAAGAAGGLLAWATGAAGSRAAPLALGNAEPGGAGLAGTGTAYPEAAGAPGGPGGGTAGPYAPGSPYRPPNPGTNPYLRVPDGLRESGDGRGAWPEWQRAPREPERGAGAGPGYGAARRPGPYDRPASGGRGPEPGAASPASPAAPAAPGRWGSPAAPGPADAPQADSHRPSEETRPGTGGDSSDVPPGSGDVYGAPTMARPLGPPPRSPRPRPAPRRGDGAPDGPNTGPPPPPPPPPPSPPPPRRPKR